MHLDHVETKILIESGLVTFLPLEGHAEDTTRSKIILKEIYNRVGLSR